MTSKPIGTKGETSEPKAGTYPKTAKIVELSAKKKEYWKNRTLDKLIQSIREGSPDLKEAKGFLLHAGLLDNKTLALFKNIEKAYNKLAERVGGLK